MNPSNNDRPGLTIHSFWTQRRRQGSTPTSSETMTLKHFLRLSISLFLGIICTTIVSLSLLLLVVNYPGISVNSLHHDFQTVQVVPVIQWSLVPPLRAAVELRWLWASSSFTLSVGLFPKERLEWIVGLLASAKMYVRMRLADHFLNRNSTLTTMTEHGIDQSRMRTAMGLSPCISPELQVNPLPFHPSSDSRHSLPPWAPDSLPRNLSDLRYCSAPPNLTFDPNPFKLTTRCDLVSILGPKKPLNLMNPLSRTRPRIKITPS